MNSLEENLEGKVSLIKKAKPSPMKTIQPSMWLLFIMILMSDDGGDDVGNGYGGEGFTICCQFDCGDPEWCENISDGF